MVISSRTPEGDPNLCPICGHRLKLEPSINTRDAPCPYCGHLLWFVPETAPEKQLAERVVEIVTMRFGMLSPSVREKIVSTSDEKILKGMVEKALTARSLEELLVGSN